jgi:hypothetical protein
MLRLAEVVAPRPRCPSPAVCQAIGKRLARIPRQRSAPGPAALHRSALIAACAGATQAAPIDGHGRTNSSLA